MTMCGKADPDQKQQVLLAIEECLVPKLATNYEDKKTHPEFETYGKNFKERFDALLELMEDAHFTTVFKGSSRIMTCLFILYKELKITCPWSLKNSVEYSKQLDESFQKLYGTDAEILASAEHKYSRQKVFDKCMEELHLKLSADNLHKYPAQVEVYCSVISNVPAYNITVNPTKTMPVALIMIDDYIPMTKVKGLSSCRLILQSLDKNVFSKGNYSEVIYISLKKVYMERDADATSHAVLALVELLPRLPKDAREKVADKLYALSLEQAVTESNIHRKDVLFGFMTRLINILGAKCMKRRGFHDAFCAGMAVCRDNPAVQEILLLDVLKCLEEWIKQTWTTWNLHHDNKILSELFGLVNSCEEEKKQNKIMELIDTLISLCTPEQQETIRRSLQNPVRQIYQENLVQNRVNGMWVVE